MTEDGAFETRETLNRIIAEEPCLRIQIFSLESVEMFERYLASQNISYAKQFSSTYTRKPGMVLLVRDSDSFDLPGRDKVILYSNMVDYRFVPYKFKLSQTEKESIVGNRALTEANKRSSASALLVRSVDDKGYTAGMLSYVQCVIVMCLLRESRLSMLFKEIRTVDPELENRFVIRCELNALLKARICTRTGNTYKIAVTRETVQRICERVGFGDIFKQG